MVNEDDFNPVIWSNLAHIRSIALKHGLPYWNIVLTSPHWSYREITEADIRLQNWGSLAYGVSGLAFYTRGVRVAGENRPADVNRSRAYSAPCRKTKP